MADYKTYAKEKRLYFIFAVVAYFVPFIIVTACMAPLMKVATGMKIAVGMGIVFINAVPFLMGIFKAFFAHFPMLNILALVFLFLAAFFTLDVFRACADKLMWIELSAAVGSVLSCFFWAKYRKYKQYNRTMKATVKSGAFVLKGENK